MSTESKRKRNFLGEFEELVLLAILKLGDKSAYGLSIAETIENATQKRVAIGALYTTLSRLEAKGFVKSYVGEATEERGGRSKRFYGIDSAGRDALDSSAKARESLGSLSTAIA
jgi:PadR family transcriptional regulator PadR